MIIEEYQTKASSKLQQLLTSAQSLNHCLDGWSNKGLSASYIVSISLLLQ